MSTKISISRIFSVGFILTFILALSFGALDATPAHAAGIRYAKPGGTGDCSNWANACTLKTALTTAVSGDEIWAAAGTYKPTTGTDRTATFQLKDGVAIYGGFAGIETARTERNPATNVTILSGDLNDDDVCLTNNSENVYQVVTGATGATLDGFTITGGHNNGPINYGGGMYNPASSSPTVTNVTFSCNDAAFGGGMYNGSGSNPTLTNVTFSFNSGGFCGGGMFNGGGNPTLTNVTFSFNSAGTSGGGMENRYDTPTLTNVTFYINASNDGGGMTNRHSNPTLTNVTFYVNTASDWGGGMFNDSSNATIRNTIFWGNTASNAGAQIYNNLSSPLVSDSVVQAGCPAGSACTNILTTDPKLAALGSYGGYTQTVPLLANSSAIDTGNDALCPATDQRGVARPQGLHCDIGAYELDTTAPMVSSVTRLNPNPTNLASVNFTVTFSEPVTGVDGSDFSLTTTGVSGASVSGVSGSGSVYTVAIDTGSGTGTIRLDVVDNDTILDLALNPLGGAGAGNGNYTSGETYDVRLHTTYIPQVFK